MSIKEFDRCFIPLVMRVKKKNGAICWGGNASKQDKSRLDKNMKKVGSVVGRGQKLLLTNEKQVEHNFG